jgi:hypothetical protein
MAGKAAIFNGGAGGLQKHATASFEAVCGQYIRASDGWWTIRRLPIFEFCPDWR